MPVVRVSSKGQATLPKELRERLGIRAPGAVMVWEEDGRLVMMPYRKPSETVAYWSKVFAGGPSLDELREEDRRAERRREERLDKVGRKGR
jgi:antitoxin PrlF